MLRTTVLGLTVVLGFLVVPLVSQAVSEIKITSPDGRLVLSGPRPAALGKKEPGQVIKVEERPWRGHDFMYDLLQNSPTEYYYRITTAQPLFKNKAVLVTIKFPSANVKDKVSSPQWRVYRRDKFAVGWNIVRKGYRLKGDHQEVDVKFERTVDFIVINESGLRPGSHYAVAAPQVRSASLGAGASDRPSDFTYEITAAEAKQGTIIKLPDIAGGQGSLVLPAGALSGDAEVQVEAAPANGYLLTGTVRVWPESVKILQPLVFWWEKGEPYLYKLQVSRNGQLVLADETRGLITGTAVGIKIKERAMTFMVSGEKQRVLETGDTNDPVRFNFGTNSGGGQILVNVGSFTANRQLSPIWEYQVFPTANSLLDPTALSNSYITLLFKPNPYRLPVVSWYNDDGTSRHLAVTQQQADRVMVALPAWAGKIGVEYDPDTYQGAASWFPTRLTRRAPLGAAANVYPNGTWVTVINAGNNKQVTVKVVSVGPYADGRIIDLTGKAFGYLEKVVKGVIRKVIVRPAKAEEIKAAERSLAPKSKKK